MPKPNHRDSERPAAGREGQRIAKLLARAGIASRREVERMIADGRVAIGGKPVETPATILTSLHGVTVDGKPVRAPAPARLFRFHKPPGLLTAANDPKGRPTIYDRLPKGLPRLMPVGRLDMNTEGLLLLTTDGELKRQMELPSSRIERTYRARAFGTVSQEQLEELIHGIEIDGVRYGPIDANLERRTGRNQWIELKLTEGKNREVRKVLEHFGLKVSRLIRTAYGPFPLADLPAGAVDEVRQHDLVSFRKGLTPPRHGEGDRAQRGGGGSARSKGLPPPGGAGVPLPVPGRIQEMRIIAGAWRGRPLAAPPGTATRPTADRAREGLFSMLQSRLGSFEGLQVADLFAGTGALGLEALSRSAAFCTFVEKDRSALDALERNAVKLGAGDRSDIRAQAVEHAPPPRVPCHLLLMDPPYRADLAQGALARIADPLWLAPGAWVSIETEGEEVTVPETLAVESDRRFGKAHILLLRNAG